MGFRGWMDRWLDRWGERTRGGEIRKIDDVHKSNNYHYHLHRYQRTFAFRSSNKEASFILNYGHHHHHRISNAVCFRKKVSKWLVVMVMGGKE